MGDLEALGESGGGTTTVGRRLVPSAPWQKPNLFLFLGRGKKLFLGWDNPISTNLVLLLPIFKNTIFHFLARWSICKYLQIICLYFPFCEWFYFLLIYAALQTKHRIRRWLGWCWRWWTQWDRCQWVTSIWRIDEFQRVFTDNDIALSSRFLEQGMTTRRKEPRWQWQRRRRPRDSGLKFSIMFRIHVQCL